MKNVVLFFTLTVILLLMQYQALARAYEGWSNKITIIPKQPKQSYQLRFQVANLIYEPGIDDINTWPLKTKKNTPVNCQYVLLVQDLRNGIKYPDFTNEHCIDLNWHFEHSIYTSLIDKRVQEPSAKYDCYALGVGTTQCNLNHWGMMQFILDGHFTKTSTAIIGGMTLHDVRFAFLGSSHCSANIVEKKTVINGVTIKWKEYIGKYGMQGVYSTTLSTVNDIYSSNSSKTAYYKRN